LYHFFPWNASEDNLFYFSRARGPEFPGRQRFFSVGRRYAASDSSRKNIFATRGLFLGRGMPDIFSTIPWRGLQLFKAADLVFTRTGPPIQYNLCQGQDCPNAPQTVHRYVRSRLPGFHAGGIDWQKAAPGTNHCGNAGRSGRILRETGLSRTFDEVKNPLRAGGSHGIRKADAVAPASAAVFTNLQQEFFLRAGRIQQADIDDPRPFSFMKSMTSPARRTISGSDKGVYIPRMYADVGK